MIILTCSHCGSKDIKESSTDYSDFKCNKCGNAFFMTDSNYKEETEE